MLLGFTIGYLLIFSMLAILRRNYEFLYYILILVVVWIVIGWYHKKLYLTNQILVGLTLVGLLHLLGGFIHMKGVRLYDVYLFEGFKYDNLVHMLATFTITFVMFNLLDPHLDPKVKYDQFLFTMVLVALASGFGAFNEIVELGAVIFLGAGKQVGDYMNNALDLVFNFLGAVAACCWIWGKGYFKEKGKNFY